MAEILRYVNTASAAGGDGTTNNTSGSTRAYGSSAECESAQQQNLVTGGNTFRAACSGSAADTTALVLAGWTTNATSFITWESNATDPNGRHAGVWDATKYHFTITNAEGVQIQADFTYFQWMQVEIIGSDSSQHNSYVVNTIGVASNGRSYLLQSILRQSPSSSGTGVVAGAVCNNVNATMICVNTFFINYKQGASGTVPRAIDTQGAGGAVHALNCGAYNCQVGFRRGSNSLASMRAINCWTQSCTTGFLLGGSGNSWATGTNYNISDLTDAPGTNVKNSATISFKDATNRDLRLASGDTVAHGFGTDLSADSTYAFTTDIEGNTRSGQWDAGPDQLIVAASNFPPIPQVISPIVSLLTM